VCLCVQMVKNHVYNMCFPVCQWQYSVCAESVHASGVRLVWAHVWFCGAVFSCLWWGLTVTPVCSCGCVDILSRLWNGWQLQVYCSGGRDFLLCWTIRQNWEAVKSCEKYKCKVVHRRILLTSIMAPWFCASVSGYDPVLGRWRRSLCHYRGYYV
jgi:hypothetical protein